ncbi:MAG: class I SAM-dependent methyltransferase [Phycisphaerales bacterium]|jgi:SAM-dependent methyltransferase|nr:class I SAM-dependent methyltransferase [Phycisphaerales bacterium]MDP6693557.1 class I SAM-dependent methyltransferase [Phycisphaerales bacterium]
MNDWLPMDEEQSKNQTQEILSLLGDSSKRVLDIGCGDGRLLLPLAIAGHEVIGIDIDAKAISACAAACSKAEVDAMLIDGNVLEELPLRDPVDVVICCGNTFMLFADVEEGVELLKLCKESLREEGMVIIDDIPGDLWPELSEGRWCNGVNDEETLQLVWSINDGVFAIREGDLVKADNWELGEEDRLLRLWTMGELRLAAMLSDLSPPKHPRVMPIGGTVLVMRAMKN